MGKQQGEGAICLPPALGVTCAYTKMQNTGEPCVGTRPPPPPPPPQVPIIYMYPIPPSLPRYLPRLEEEVVLLAMTVPRTLTILEAILDVYM